MTDCLFCKMACKDIEPDIVYEDDNILAFKDINPQAPVHILIIPRRHISTINDLLAEDGEIISNMVLIAKKIAADCQIDESGYRLVFNCNANGGQSVFHIHLHLLGGRAMSWPPG